ncbi:MAG: S8 family serine peptidase, partial [Clostridia bacterium]|nr:S8 family serine peptidase [Clostridia bacterium]
GKVESITPYLFNIPERMSEEIVLSQIGAGENGTNSPKSDLTGNGVKVGVISAENIIFDNMAKGLLGKDITVYPSVIPPKTDRHPTCVLSEIISKRVTAEGAIFFGVVRDAEAYFAPTYSEKNVYDAIEQMLRDGVRVINYSAGSMHDGVRGDFDRQIDRLIVNNNFLFVTAAGNYTKTASPGKAYNALTVGNAVTKSAPLSAIMPPYKMGDTSAYSTAPSLPHKPEISAPGEWIGFVDRRGRGDFQNFGTSFATPFVSGVAVQLLEVRGDVSYLTLKGVILMAAKRDVISPEGNDYVNGSYMRERSGYGLLNAEEAVRILKNADITEGVLKDGAVKDILSGDLFFIFELFEDMVYPRIFLDGDEVALNYQTSILLKGVSGRLVIEGDTSGRFSLIVL